MIKLCSTYVICKKFGKPRFAVVIKYQNRFDHFKAYQNTKWRSPGEELGRD